MIISIVGAGGKTTISNIIGQGIAQKSGNVLFTTTTKIWRPEPIPVYIGDAAHLPLVPGFSVAAKRTLENGKLDGFSPAQLKSIIDSGRFNHILVEADGAKGRSIKCPNDTEPVYPLQQDLIIGVIGLDCIGKRIADETVHRSELFTHVTDSKAGQEIDFSHVLKLIQHPKGLFAHAPGDTKKIVFLNKHDLMDTKNKQKLLAFVNEITVPVIITSKYNDWFEDFYTQHLTERIPIHE